MRGKLLELLAKYDSIEQSLMDPTIASQPSELQRLGKARAELEDVVQVIRRYHKTEKDLAESEALLSDPEMKELAQDEVSTLREQLGELTEELRLLLLPKDPNDQKSDQRQEETKRGSLLASSSACIFATQSAGGGRRKSLISRKTEWGP
jgi:peptide chain release factor 1